ncbi:hypothetical protein [Engelhardtia mirabilis]|uniref:Uncharacterized protein n=1 Tax=Engelhardtia mirabilis TaxID=2528011 RepID=A0A518BM03_9BACT|nr:hypothetical protein Pla133_30950 [Planctomycetes bacterium Pla133]QDV02330.1 hypothetical protein Pla86_30940 [Planctomycetes bacterium Pla86]
MFAASSRLCSVALALSSLASAATAQWSSTSYDPLAGVDRSGSILIHDDGTALRGFAALGSGWVDLAASGATVHGVAEHLALIEDAGTFIAWNARSGALESLTVAGTAWIGVDDEVALVIEDDAGALTAHALSALHDGWHDLPLGNFTLDPFDVALDDGVVCVRRPDGYSAFGARCGTWGEFAVPVTGDYAQSFGNVAIASLFNFSTLEGEPFYAAFSGHTGTWAVSTEAHFSTNPRLMRDACYIREKTLVTQRYRSLVFDGFLGEWVVSEVIHPSGTTEEHPVGHMMTVYDVVEVRRIETYAPAGGLGWVSRPGDFDLLVTADDTLILTDFANDELHATGALLGEGWNVRSAPAPHEPIPGPRAFALVRDAVGDLHAYLPRRGNWASPLSVPGATVAAGETVALALEADGSRVWAFCARRAQWVSRDLPAGATSLHVGASIAAVQTDSSLAVFDAFAGVWRDAGLLAAGESLEIGRDHLAAVDVAGGTARAWSAAPAQWQMASLAVGAIADGPHTEGRATWLEDAAGELWAFGSLPDGFLWQDWPDGQEPLWRPENAPAPSNHMHYGVAGDPGDRAFVLIGAGNLADGVSVSPFSGLLYLTPSSTVFTDLGAIGSTGTTSFDFALPAGLLPGVEVWFQPLFVVGVDQLRFGTAAQPAIGF